ncbi:MAG TPA: hypothetical protein VHH09_06400 [Acidimicrobiales bacterium]|nr:hypothetical protein [Acidimicrobiales bacterium]
MGFLDKAKKLVDQAKDKAEEALTEVKSRVPSADVGTSERSAPIPTDARVGTPYVPGMLGKPGWRERGLTDPAALLPVADRDRAGIPHSTRSEILEEPFGMGRRWSSGGRSAGLFYQLDPEHLAWEPPLGRTPSATVPDAMEAKLPDGRTLLFLGHGDRRVVLELSGLDDAAPSLARAVEQQLAAG